MSLDREQLIREVYEGAIESANVLLPPGATGSSAKLQDIPFDPQAARQLLAKSQHAGRRPEIIFSTVDVDGEPSRSVQFMVAARQEELDVEVKMEPDGGVKGELHDPEVWSTTMSWRLLQST